MNIMNMTKRPVAAFWNRADHILFGQRLYSNPILAAWLAGEKPKKTIVKDTTPLTPEAASAKWLSRLDDLDEGYEPSGRYLSVTERLHRLSAIADYFAAIRDGHITPARYPRTPGAPFWMPNDGPSCFWRAWAEMVWAAMPANDSEIFGRTAITSSPKNKHLATRLKPMLAWRKISTPITPPGTNWMQPDNDNYKEGEERPATNHERRIRPGDTDRELISFINKAGPVTVRKHAKLNGGGELEAMPTDLTWQTVTDKTNRRGEVTKSHNAIVRAGKLRLANGKTTALCSVKRTDIRIEEGTILYQPDKFGETLGPKPALVEKVRAASYWASLFKVDRETVIETDEDGKERPVFIKGGKMRRTVLITEEEQRELLAGALPPITYYPDGLPRGSEDIAGQFVGGWVSQTKGKAPPERWEDMADELARRDEFERQVAALPPEQRRALDMATTAANFKEVGETFGKVDKAAERHGKKALIAANDNLAKIIAAA